MVADFTKLPRLYIDRSFTPNASIPLETAQSHYLKNVLRTKPGEFIRIFNGQSGEWLAEVTFVKNDALITLKGKIREQPAKSGPIHLLFAPIKKDRTDILIEKAVELGVTDLHPVLTARTQMRIINEDRMRAQIAEAAEQCERFEIPALHPVADLKTKLQSWKEPLLWCSERGNAPHLSTFSTDNWAFLIGPEGGFDDSEVALLSGMANVKPLTLGEAVLRAETAAMLALGYAKIQAKR